MGTAKPTAKTEKEKKKKKERERLPRLKKKNVGPRKESSLLVGGESRREK